MFKILLKKQFNELFHRFSYNPKSKKQRSVRSAVIFIILYGLLLFGIIGGAVGYGTYQLAQPFSEVNMGWMYFLLVGMAAVAIGAFGSVFSTYSSLYLSKDNDLLVSLPIPTSSIIMARLTSVYIMGFLFSGIVTIPAVIVYWTVIKADFWTVICSIVFILIISFIVLILSCVLGWCVAKVASKAKNKSNVTMVFSLIFFALYSLVYYQAQAIITGLIANVLIFGQTVKSSLYPLYMFGRIGEGDILAAVIYIVITGILLFVVYRLLARSFVNIVSASKNGKKTVYKEKNVKRKGQTAAVVSKEFKRFTSSAAYMLNCAMGSIGMIIISIFFIVKRDFLQTINDVILPSDGGADILLYIEQFIPVVVVALVCLLISANDVVVPSVSLEGKNIWIMQSLPIEPWTVLKGKLITHLLITGIPLVIVCVSMLFALNISVAQLLVIYLAITVYMIFMSLFGLFLGIKMPNLTWTNEMTPIKQGGSIFISVFGGIGISILLAVIFFVVGKSIGSIAYLIAISAVFVILSIMLYLWIKNKGCKIFATL